MSVVVGPLATTVRRIVRLVATYWPAVIAWLLVGTIGRYVTIQFAGWVGATSAFAGLALMPFAILSRLVAFVAMLLIVRDGMPHLTAIAPTPASSGERRREFVDALLAGILPFFAFYLAWGFLRDDMASYYIRLYGVQFDRGLLFQESDVSTGDLTLTWFTGTVIVITFVLRRVIKRLSNRSSRIVPLVAVYVEALWVFLSALVINRLITGIRAWVSTRQGVAWMTGVQDWVAQHATPLDWVLEFGGWIIGEAGGLMLYPLAWLTIAGVIYGQTVTPPPLAAIPVAERLAENRRLQRVRSRAGRVPGWVRNRLRDLWDDLVERFRPIGAALRLMWHVGPVLIAGYVLFYQGYLWLEAFLKVVFPRLFGPHSRDFWVLYHPAIFLIGPVVAAPVGIAVTAAAFDGVLARSRQQAVVDAA